MKELKQKLLTLSETCKSESELCEGFINALERHKSELSKYDRCMYLIDVILNNQIFDEDL